MMRQKHVTFWLTSIVFLCHLVICHAQGLDVPAFGKVTAPSLCFDLRNDDKIKGGLILPLDQKSIKGDHSYFIPFKIDQVNLDEDLLARYGAYEKFSVITITNDTTKLGIQSISFNPHHSELIDTTYNVDELDDCLYLKRNGLERHFIFKYPEIGRTKAQWVKANSMSKFDDMRYVAVILPKKSSGIEIAGSGKTEIPDRESVSGEARFFPGSTNFTKAEQLRVSFRLPPTGFQTLFADYFIKLFGGLILPLITIILIKPQNSQHNRRRKIIVYSLIAVQVTMILFYVYFSYNYWSQDYLKAGLDVLVVLVTSLLTAYAAWAKDNVAGGTS